MSIIHNAEKSTITLHTDNTSYQIKIGPFGLLQHTYYGPHMEEDAEYCVMYRDRGFTLTPYDAERKRWLSAELMPLEYPCEAAGDFRAPALSIRRKDGILFGDMRYESHRIEKGKYSLEGLPAVYDDTEEAETLTVVLKEKNTNIRAVLQYGVLPHRDVITRTARIENGTEDDIVLTHAASACLDLVSGEWDVINFHGRHAGERNVSRTPSGHRETVVGTRRGASSHHQNPFVILAEKDAGELHGQCYGMSFLYSGSFSCSVSGDAYGGTRMVMGIQPDNFDYVLTPGESFQAPETALAYSCEGLAKLSQIYHKLISQNICRGPWKNRRRPVLINNWEATGPDFTAEKILHIAEKAASLGVEMLVLDDGWFGKRDDDFAGLGDWYVNTEKLGCTMGELAASIRDLGMKFGIWIEPEMVNEDSDLYRAHPDWSLQVPGIEPALGRSQLVLDFSREEVVDYILDHICKVLDESRADYVKMDMNRPIFDVYNALFAYQSRGKIMYKYILGVYRFMEKLLERYPDLLLEGCASGGGRFDAGMLYYCPQIWCSDNTDGIDRIRIQYGTSFGYPVRTMGAHVSRVPNYDTRRIVPFDTRAVIAMEGTFGYELDLNTLSEEEARQVPVQIETFKKYWDLLHNGLYYRLTDVTHNTKEAAWMMVAEDRSEALLNIVVLDVSGNRPNRFVRLAGLDASASYKDEANGAVYSAAALMSVGIPLPKVPHEKYHWMRDLGEYESVQIHFTKVTD